LLTLRPRFSPTHFHEDPERNPVTGIPKRKEAGGRVVFVLESEEAAIRDALPEVLKPLFIISIHTGLRWSEQAGLHWRDVDVLTGVITVRLSKNGASRQVPMNATVRAALMELAMRRQQTDDPEEPVTGISYRHMNRLFLRAVERATQALRDAGADTTRLRGYTWHGNRHSFASRLVMAGVDPLTLQKLGGWKTLSMVQRYSHLSPGHLRAAVELLDAGGAADAVPASQLARNLTGAASVTAPTE
jgi:site-specific recombinase XerD